MTTRSRATVTKIRAYKPTDLGRCVKLFVKVFSQPPWEDQWPSEERAGEYLSDIVGTPGFEGYVAYEGRRILGLCFGHRVRWWAGDEFYLDELCVDSDVQRQGIGTELMNHLWRRLARQGIQVVVLLTQRNTLAEAFYARQGFLISPRTVFMYRQVE